MRFLSQSPIANQPTENTGNSSGGSGSASNTRILPSSNGNSGFLHSSELCWCHHSSGGGRCSSGISHPRGNTSGSMVSMSKGGSGGGGSEIIPSHIPHNRRKNSISARPMMVPTFFICDRQQGQVVGSPPQIRLIRDFQSGFSACFFLGVCSGRMNKVLSRDSESKPREEFLVLFN